MNNKLKLIGILLLSFALAACSKLNLENYEQLKLGMEMNEVEGLIGGASDCSEALGTQSCYWGDTGGVHIKINFVAGKAITFSHDGLK
jgi:hypothetical protein